MHVGKMAVPSSTENGMMSSPSQLETSTLESMLSTVFDSTSSVGQSMESSTVSPDRLLKLYRYLPIRTDEAHIYQELLRLGISLSPGHGEKINIGHIGGSDRNSYFSDRDVGMKVMTPMESYGGRSISLIGVLGGILIILIIIALISCLKHKKRISSRSDDHLSVDMISTQLRGLHQLQSNSNALCVETPPPPDYESVVKQKQEEEDQLPSYSEALEKCDDPPEYSQGASSGENEITLTVHNIREDEREKSHDSEA